MTSGQQPSTDLRWRERSVEHKGKLQNLQIKNQDQLRVIDGYVTCQENEFKVGHPTPDGTCVYVGLRVSDGKEVAVKCMLTDNCEHLAENEINILNMLKMEKSPHVVRYLHYKRGDPFVYIVLELCEFSLKEYVHRVCAGDQVPFNPRKIIKEILTGLDILHNKQGNEGTILHRDLKPDNVLIDVEWSVRLADFGVSKTVGEGSSTNHTSGKGNAEWQAAESIPIEGEDQQVVYKRKSDIQVAGMLSFYVLTKGHHPFGDISYERPNNIYHGRPVSLDRLTDPVEKDFVSWLLQKDCNDRPFADEALKHPFFRSVEEQFNFLVAMGNQREIVQKDESCDVVTELNNHLNEYPNGWKEKIHPQVVHDFSMRQYDSNNLCSLLRFLRNVKEHIDDSRIPEQARILIGEPAAYFLHSDRFSTLPMLVHKILREQAKDIIQSRSSAEPWINRPALKSFV